MISVGEVFEAYYECRKHKRRTVNALAFELDFEYELIALWRELNSGNYQLRRSMAFILISPVQREIFAADFRDRIVHHLIMGKINQLLEDNFIADTYSCRKGKGGLAGVKQVVGYMHACSENYTADCYIMKLDLQAFFPSIDMEILFCNLKFLLNEKYLGEDKEILLSLFEKTIFARPQEDCIIKGSMADWRGLPLAKSLFGCDDGKGLPIGNLTSQMLANFYLTPLDKFIKEELKNQLLCALCR